MDNAVGIACSKIRRRMGVWAIAMLGCCIIPACGHQKTDSGHRGSFIRHLSGVVCMQARLNQPPFAFNWMDAAPMIRGEGLNFTRREAGEEELTFGSSAMENIAAVYSSRLFWTPGTGGSGRDLDASVPADFLSLKDAVVNARAGQRILIARAAHPHRLKRPLTVRGSSTDPPFEG
eukprot:2805828-Rhodomonas_salina.6